MQSYVTNTACLLLLFLVLSSSPLLATSLRPPNGPFQVPLLGSVGFLYKLLVQKEPLPVILREYRLKYGDLVQIRTGPINQYWVTAPETALAAQLLSSKECSGRSQLKEPAFGDEFLFLTRDVDQARIIRKSQREWLRERAGPSQVSQTVHRIFPDIVSVFSATGAREGERCGVWDQTAFSGLTVRALLGTMIGGPTSEVPKRSDWKEGWLSDTELDDLLALTEMYRRRAPNPSHRQELRKLTREGCAGRITSLLKTALARSSEQDESLRDRNDLVPILVSAIVGGAEIYPLLLHWAVRHLAVSPGLQMAIRRDIKRAPDGGYEYGSFIPKVVSHIAHTHPYSAAIGPPRKVTQDVNVRVVTSAPGQERVEEEVVLDKEAILFVTHPALFTTWTDRFSPEARIATVRASRESANDAILEVIESRTDRWPMFGMGERSCIASEMSVSFLSSFLSYLVSEYDITVGKRQQSYMASDLFSYREDGSLLVPDKMDIQILLVPILDRQ